MNQRENVQRLMQEAEQTGELIWKQDPKCYQRIKDMTEELVKVLPQFISCISTYQLTDIAVETVLNQLRCLIGGLENRDEILIADTLNYELYNTLAYYDKFLEALEEENV